MTMTHPYPISPENIVRVRLANGLTIIVRDSPYNPSVVLRGRLHAGALYDGETPGLARLTVAAMQRGTPSRSFHTLGEQLDRRGMSFGLISGMENIAFVGRALSEDFPRLVEAGADVLRNPAFEPAEVEMVRRQIISSFLTADHETRHVAYRELRALCYPPSHPYHHLPEGSLESIRGLPVDALRAFHARYFRPDLMTIAVVGDVRPAEAIAQIERAFGDWQASGPVPPYGFPPAPPLDRTVRRVSYIQGKTQAEVMLGFIGVRRTDPDFYALSLADLVLGRLGLRGRLGASVRDQHGLAYYVGSTLEAGVAAGPWLIFGGVSPQNLERAIEGMRGEIARLCAEPISAEEMDEARDHLTGSLALRLETNDGVANALNDIELFDLGYDFLYRYAAIIRGISSEQVLAALRRTIDPERYVLSIAGSVAAA